MDAGANSGNNFALYLMLVICVILVSLDSLELYRLGMNWSHIQSYGKSPFGSCIRNELITKTIFGFFSLLSGISALLLTIFLMIDVEIFIRKFFSAYLNMIYSIFGPIMLGFSILGLVNWDDIVYICDRSDPRDKYFSFGGSFSLLGCFIISLLVTLTFATYEVVNLYIESILGREGHNKIIRHCFWWVVMRVRPNVAGNSQDNQNNQDRNSNNDAGSSEERLVVNVSRNQN